MDRVSVMEIPCDTGFASLRGYLVEKNVENVFLVCGQSAESTPLGQFLRGLEKEGKRITRFMGFSPNPEWPSLREGVKVFREEKYDLLLAVGGGSAIDVAKGIRLYSGTDLSGDASLRERSPSKIPFVAAPTTAGSGSEATRFAVIYRDGEKMSITDEMALPDAVILDPSALHTLPVYQKKATLLDALCHAIESFWSVHATDESRLYAEKAIRLIMAHTGSYLQNEVYTYPAMMQASNLAGKAINISRTTAGHAMCYKLTTGYGLAHGHAAALCVAELWPYMLKHVDDPSDPNDEGQLREMFVKLSRILTGDPDAAADAGAVRFREFVFNELEMESPNISGDDELAKLASSVNPERLQNHPITLSVAALRDLYAGIAKKGRKNA